MNVTSISDKLKAVVLSGLLTVSAAQSSGAYAQDATHAANNKQQTTASTTVAQRSGLIGSVPGSLENLFTYFEPSDKYWSAGKAFAEKSKAAAQNNKFWPTQVYTGMPPATAYMEGYNFVPGGALNVKQFSDYIKFTAQNGNPGLGNRNFIIPKVIIGVVTPRDTANIQFDWRKRMDLAKELAVESMQKYGASHGASVWEIVRVIADDDETIYSEILDQNASLKNAYLISVGNRISYQGLTAKDALPNTPLELQVGLEAIFEANKHILTPAEYAAFACERDNNCPQNASTVKKDGKSSAGGKSSGGSAAAGAVVAANGPGL